MNALVGGRARPHGPALLLSSSSPCPALLLSGPPATTQTGDYSIFKTTTTVSVSEVIQTVLDVGSGRWRLGLTILEFAVHWQLNRLTVPGLEVPRALTCLRVVVRALQETAASNDDGGGPGVTALFKTLQYL